MAWATLRSSSVIAGQPRSPPAAADCSVTGSPNVRPPSCDRAILIAVEAPRAVHNTATSGPP